ncbi:MAG: GrpB family protein [Thermoflexales bacterium]|nr:GrpB family protein [Thermoflexales bacterium]
MTIIGLERDVVRLVSYHPGWPRLFEEEKARLQAAVGAYVLDIQPIGSTSIPGGVAKPIIDIGIAVESFEGAFVCVGPMERLGYEYGGENGIPRRHYFVKRVPDTTHHVHMFEESNPAWGNHILFRDYMRKHPAAVEEYTALKLALAERFPRDRGAYTDGKAAFIERILCLARSDEENTRCSGKAINWNQLNKSK